MQRLTYQNRHPKLSPCTGRGVSSSVWVIEVNTRPCEAVLKVGVDRRLIVSQWRSPWRKQGGGQWDPPPLGNGRTAPASPKEEGPVLASAEVSVRTRREEKPLKKKDDPGFFVSPMRLHGQ